jgi:drug/metabolite transporter (DMT)-like permease
VRGCSLYTGAMLTVLSGLLASLCYATSDLFSQRVTRETRALTQVLWVLSTGVLVIVPLAIILRGIPGRGDLTGTALAALAGALYFAAALCLFQGLSTGDLGLVSALCSLQGAYVAVVVIILGEPVTPLLAAGLASCALGGVLTSFEGRARSTRGAVWAIAAGVTFAAALLCYNYSSLDWLSQAAVSRAVSVAVAVPVALLTGSVAVPKGLRGQAAGAGVLEVCGLLLLTFTFSLGPAAVAGVTTAQYGTFAVMLGYVLLRERPRPNQWVGVACTIVGVSVLTAIV